MAFPKRQAARKGITKKKGNRKREKGSLGVLQPNPYPLPGGYKLVRCRPYRIQYHSCYTFKLDTRLYKDGKKKPMAFSPSLQKGRWHLRCSYLGHQWYVARLIAAAFGNRNRLEFENLAKWKPAQDEDIYEAMHLPDGFGNTDQQDYRLRRLQLGTHEENLQDYRRFAKRMYNTVRKNAKKKKKKQSKETPQNLAFSAP